MDLLLMGWRIYCRDYEVSEGDQEILAALEKEYQGEFRRLEEWRPPGWDLDDDEEEEGGAHVTV